MFKSYHILWQDILCLISSEKIFVPVVLKTAKINNETEKLLSVPKNVEKTFTYVTKLNGASTGVCGIAKSGVDLAVVPGVGVCADILQMATTCVPGANYTTCITLPISWGGKVFFYCKKAQLSWGEG